MIPKCQRSYHNVEFMIFVYAFDNIWFCKLSQPLDHTIQILCYMTLKFPSTRKHTDRDKPTNQKNKPKDKLIIKAGNKEICLSSLSHKLFPFSYRCPGRGKFKTTSNQNTTKGWVVRVPITEVSKLWTCLWMQFVFYEPEVNHERFWS